jgi:hypothetical protein
VTPRINRAAPRVVIWDFLLLLCVQFRESLYPEIASISHVGNRTIMTRPQQAHAGPPVAFHDRLGRTLEGTRFANGDRGESRRGG